ncbi:chemotaxis protein CheW [Aquisalimonas lutea]|uniref:chemotaxis protein CheW n=1 Tax=Aquisalimonas lutea TaxID=1327750 RepID=UPI0025B5281E|nr:chemotaxis protein CheW [Aquisalimonas lutea]MDN3518303.1 chemotaxis protein CheW [Aquisalimonas lutea]
MIDSTARRQETLVEQQDAIRDYLDALLQDIPEDMPEADEPAAPAEPVPAPEEAVPSPPPATAPEPAEDAPEPTAVAAPEAEIRQPAAEEQPGPADMPPPEEVREGPEREPEAMQALFFDVGGLRLAVPLTELHSVVPWTEVDVTPMPRQPDWHWGLMRYRGRNVRVIDTATMVLPPDKRNTDEARAEPRHILVVGDGSWGLACHDIGDVVRLGADEVKWRRRGSARPWLAGTVINHLSAVIDTSAFARMLDSETSR